MKKEADKILEKVKLINKVQDKYVAGQITLQECTAKTLKLKYIGNNEIEKIADETLGNVKIFKEIEEKYIKRTNYF